MKSLGLLFLLGAISLIIITCDDDPTGPSNNNTPTPSISTPTPTAVPTTTPVPSYDGGWYGIMKTNSPSGCPDEKVWFTLENDTLLRTHARFWTSYYWCSGHHLIELSFTGACTGDHLEGYYHYYEFFTAETYFKIEGDFRSAESIEGTWTYASYGDELPAYMGSGSWFAWRVN